MFSGSLPEGRSFKSYPAQIRPLGHSLAFAFWAPRPNAAESNNESTKSMAVIAGRHVRAQICPLSQNNARTSFASASVRALIASSKPVVDLRARGSDRGHFGSSLPGARRWRRPRGSRHSATRRSLLLPNVGRSPWRQGRVFCPCRTASGRKPTCPRMCDRRDSRLARSAKIGWQSLCPARFDDRDHETIVKLVKEGEWQTAPRR